MTLACPDRGTQRTDQGLLGRVRRPTVKEVPCDSCVLQPLVDTHNGRLHPRKLGLTTATATAMSSGDESAPDLSSANGTPRKRRRLESLEPSRVRKYYLEGKYNDAYRVLFNDHVTRVAAPFVPDHDDNDAKHHYTTQYGASTWSSKEQAVLFAALERLGRHDVAGIAQAVGTKTTTETQALLLLLHDAATQKGDLGLTLRHVPAAVEIRRECNEELDVMAEALAWYQEQWEVVEEQKRYGDHWLITPTLAADIEFAINGPSRAASSTRPTTPADPGTPRTGPGIAGYDDTNPTHTHHTNFFYLAPASAASSTRFAATARSHAPTVHA